MLEFMVKVDLRANGVVGKDNPYETNTIVTECNGPEERIREYYAIGKTFNLGVWGTQEHEDNLMHVTHVFVLPNDKRTSNFFDWVCKKYSYEWQKHFTEEEYKHFCAEIV